MENCRKTGLILTCFLTDFSYYPAKTHEIIGRDSETTFTAHLTLILYIQLHMNWSVILAYVSVFMFDMKIKFCSALNEDIGYE